MLGRDAEDRRGGTVPDRRRTSYDDFRSARERFFEQLRADSEVRRLEGAWRLPARERTLDDRAT